MDKLKTYFKKLEKTKGSSNYWLRFDARVEDLDCELQSALDHLYSEIPQGAITVKKSSEQKILKHLESCLAYPLESCESASDQASHLLGLSQEIVGTNQCIYFKLCTSEDEHPTPGIYWDFWYLILANSGARVLAISGSACD